MEQTDEIVSIINRDCNNFVIFNDQPNYASDLWKKSLDGEPMLEDYKNFIKPIVKKSNLEKHDSKNQKNSSSKKFISLCSFIKTRNLSLILKSNTSMSIIKQDSRIANTENHKLIDSQPKCDKKVLFKYFTHEKSTQRFNLLNEGDVNVCKTPHSRNIISKVLNLRLLRRWKAHRINLTEIEIILCSEIDYVNQRIPYNTIEDVSPVNKLDTGHEYCFRITTLYFVYLFQTTNQHSRDQWIYSIIWKRNIYKYGRILRAAVRPEVFIKEFKNMIDMSLTIPIDDAEIYHFPLELISDIFKKNNVFKQAHEEIIVALGPILEKYQPSKEICIFFTKYCRDYPRSKLVIDLFSPVVRRILKHNSDFSRYPYMRQFVHEYIAALSLQNIGLNAVQDFVISLHGNISSKCPFPRVLPNLVSISLASIQSCFEERNNKKNQEEKLICYGSILYTLSTFEDWRLILASLLQSIPFSKEVLSNIKFKSITKEIIKNIAEDKRCEVHLTLIGIRDDKDGWLEIFCPGNATYLQLNDEIFILMLNTLIKCCCKKKKFLWSFKKLIPQMILMSLREYPITIETLCAMLELDVIDREHKLEVISTLQSTQIGAKMYSQLCERQIQLKDLQEKGGPRKLTLPCRSTDADLEKLLMSGCFGNLECLSLAFTNITSACAKCLIKIPSLKYLNLWSTQFGDQGLELISEHLLKLQVLNLCETPVTDKGLLCLASLKELRKLNLNSTNLSNSTFENLKERLPALQECDIRYTDAW